jgi:hypothetical protein
MCPRTPVRETLLNSTSKPSILGAFYTGMRLHIDKRYEILESNYFEEFMEIQNKKRRCVLGYVRQRETEWMSA